MIAGDSGPATEGLPALPAPRANGLFAGPADAPDRYELLGEGRRGGEGITWQARYHGALRKAVPLAVKMLNRPRRADAGWPSAEMQQRWKDQTVLLQHLHLEHVVGLHEIFVGPPPHRPGEGNGAVTAYLCMEWVDGPTLAELAGGRPATAATLAQRLQYVRDVAEALEGLHSSGNPSLHRDVKPANCIVHPARGVVLIDVSAMRTLDDGFDTQGMFTPAYTAPEILRNPHRPRHPSGDRYALGALAVFCLAGDDPPPAGAAVGDRVAPRLVAVARAAGIAAPDPFVAHLLHMLRSDPAARPADPIAWAQELTRLAAAPALVPPARRSRRRAALAAGGLAAVAAGALAFTPIMPWRSAHAITPTPTAPVRPSPSAPAVPRPTIASTAAPSIDPAVSPTGARVTPPPTPPTVRRSTAAAVARSTGRFATPASGAAVLNCAFFTGTAHLAAGDTLILAARNLDNNDSHRYVQFVENYDKPATLSSWRGHQYFGTQPGQRYRIDLVAVGLDVARAADRSGSDDAVDALAGEGTTVASREVVQESGNTGDVCDY